MNQAVEWLESQPMDASQMFRDGEFNERRGGDTRLYSIKKDHPWGRHCDLCRNCELIIIEPGKEADDAGPLGLDG